MTPIGAIFDCSQNTQHSCFKPTAGWGTLVQHEETITPNEFSEAACLNVSSTVHWANAILDADRVEA